MQARKLEQQQQKEQKQQKLIFYACLLRLLVIGTYLEGYILRAFVGTLQGVFVLLHSWPDIEYVC